MLPAGRRSRGCDPCRVRKIKCDEEFPYCFRCRSTYRVCPGPQRGLIFVNKTLQDGGKRESTKGHSSELSQPGESASSSTTKHKDRENQIDVVADSETRLELFAASDVDPFSFNIMQLNQGSKVVLDFYLKIMSQKILPINPPGIWFPVASTSPPLLFATLYVTAKHYETAVGLAAGSVSTMLGQKTLRTLIEDLKDPNQGTSDSTIAVTATLASYESLNGDLSVLKSHLNGLKQMVKIRGGIEKLGLQGLIQRTIVSADLYDALRRGSNRQFNFTKSSSTFSPEVNTSATSKNASMTHLGIGFKPLADLFSANFDVMASIQTLCYLSRVLETSLEERLSPEDQWVFDEWLTGTEIEISRARNDLKLPEGCKRHEIIKDAWSLGLFLYINGILRQLPPRAVITQWLVGKLHEVLKYPDKSVWQGFSEFYLWLLCLGGELSTVEDITAWYVRRLSEFLVETKPRGLQDVQEILSEYLWLDKICTPLISALWCRAMDVGKYDSVSDPPRSLED